jgi:hypothetical protein
MAAEEAVHDRSRALEAQIKEVEEKKVCDGLNPPPFVNTAAEAWMATLWMCPSVLLFCW